MEKEKSQCKRNRQPSEPPGDAGDSIAKKPRDTDMQVDGLTNDGAPASEENDGAPATENQAAPVTEESTENKLQTKVVAGESTETHLDNSCDSAKTDPVSKTIQPISAVNSATQGGPVAKTVTSSTPSPVCRDYDDSIPGNDTDSDLDYDDLDELVVNSDMEDLMDDEDGIEGGEDDQSVASTVTTMSTGSVGSNTPSLVGENLETISIGDGERRKTWVSVLPSTTDSPPLRLSQFPNVPPTINFMLHNEVSSNQLPDELRKQLKWRLSNITPAIVKRCASNTGFRLMRKTCIDWTATWGKHMKSPQFREVKSGQKINHFPGTFNIGRKDRLWKNYHRLMLKFGKSEFGFLPRTFCLPADTKLLRKVWERRGGKGRWIVKPPALARGVGIKVVNKWSQIPKTRPLLVQRYLARPYLINETKFDLRLYVLITSVDPLRIYLYDDGLVRFASNKYTNDTKSVGDVYTHLTNYSINKNSASYLANEDSEVRQGHKWTLKSLWRHFDELGIDHSAIWEKIKDLIVKTIISAENQMATLFQQNVTSRYSCYELFGFDIMLDSRLKPWVIEVNISPSLHSTSPLDLDVKSPLATEVFNMARYHLPNKLRQSTQKQIAESLGYGSANLCLDKRLYLKEISKAERLKHDSWLNVAAASGSTVPPAGILDHLTPDDTRHLVVAEDELATSRRFSRIFPTNATDKYLKFCEKPRYYNLLLAAWEIKYSGINREKGRAILTDLCNQKHHLKVPANVYVKKTPSGQQTIDISGLTAPTDAAPTSLPQTDTPTSHSPSSDSAPSHPNHAPKTTTVESTKKSDDNTSIPLVSPNLTKPSTGPVKSSPLKTTKVAKLGVVAKPFHVKSVPPASNRLARLPSHECGCVRIHMEDCRNRLRASSGSESDCRMDCGSITPSPGCTPEHPGATPPYHGTTPHTSATPPYHGTTPPHQAQVNLFNERNLASEKREDIMSNQEIIKNSSALTNDFIDNMTVSRPVDNSTIGSGCIVDNISANSLVHPVDNAPSSQLQ